MKGRRKDHGVFVLGVLNWCGVTREINKERWKILSTGCVSALRQDHCNSRERNLRMHTKDIYKVHTFKIFPYKPIEKNSHIHNGFWVHHSQFAIHAKWLLCWIKQFGNFMMSQDVTPAGDLTLVHPSQLSGDVGVEFGGEVENEKWQCLLSSA